MLLGFLKDREAQIQWARGMFIIKQKDFPPGKFLIQVHTCNKDMAHLTLVVNLISSIIFFY